MNRLTRQVVYEACKCVAADKQLRNESLLHLLHTHKYIFVDWGRTPVRPSLDEKGRNFMERIERDNKRRALKKELTFIGRFGIKTVGENVIVDDYVTSAHMILVLKLLRGDHEVTVSPLVYNKIIKRLTAMGLAEQADDFVKPGITQAGQAWLAAQPGQINDKPSIYAIDGHVDLSRDAKPSVVGMSFDDVIKAYELVTEYRNLREQRFQLKVEMSKLSDELKRLNIKFD